MQTVDLALAVARMIAIFAFKRPRCLLKLLLPGANLIRMHLIALGQVGHRRLFLQRLQCNFRLQRRVDLPSRSSLSSPAPSVATERLWVNVREVMNGVMYVVRRVASGAP